MKIKKRKHRAGRVAISVIVPWYAELGNTEAEMFCMLATDAIPDDINAMCVDGVLGFEKQHHGAAVKALREFGDKIDMDAVRDTLESLLKEGIVYIDKSHGHLMIKKELMEGELVDIEVNEDCFYKEIPETQET